jgi:predicted metalloprotease
VEWVVRRAPLLALVIVAVAACSPTDNGITVEEAALRVPPTTAAAMPEPQGTLPAVASDTLRVVGDKPSQPYDGFLATAIEDIEAFWTSRFPEVSGGAAYPGLQGGVYPMWPEVGDVPGCGERLTSYREVRENAFYCTDGDFIAYDDAGLFPELAEHFDDLVIGVVMAHEWGHHIQALQRYQLQPVIYELQADCFAGSWVEHLVADDGAFLAVDDNQLHDVLSGVIAFRDDPGTPSTVQGAHGSAFDRVSAFQDGLEGGVAACDGYASDAPPTLALTFISQLDLDRGGDFPYDQLVRYDPSNDDAADGEVSLPETLDVVWSELLAEEGAPNEPLGPTLTADDECAQGDSASIGGGVEYCAEPGEVVVDEETTRQLHDEFGDFTVGLLFAEAWAEAGQRALGLDVVGADAEEQRDCYSGVFVATIFPEQVNEVFPDGAPFRISPGDLDEAVQMLLFLTEGQEASAARALERLNSFRAGLLGTLDRGAFPAFDACTSA